MKTLVERLGISRKQANEAVQEILAAIDILEEQGTLPARFNYSLHELEQDPWKGFMEFHALDDVLVVYLAITQKYEIRMIGIYNHDLLASSRLD